LKNLKKKRKKEEEKRKKDADDKRRKEKEALAREEEYIKSKEGSRQLQDAARRRKQQSILSKTVNPVACTALFEVTEYEIKKKQDKPDFVVFRMNVTFDDTEWTVFRRWKQFLDLDSVFKRNIPGYTDCLPKIKKANAKAKFDTALLDERRRGLDVYVRILEQSRSAIFESEQSASMFFRFIAPSQLGDIKPGGFIMPFKIKL